ncbi:leucine-rich repeat domain-containing protein [Herpetosiphon sp. NSE202]|uniref:leucine-rich repeat domain-containing protein n=1 Tax=Herpetosiphon sp. NSE202 TaxID=3351349 RepID=UPI0036267496
MNEQLCRARIAHNAQTREPNLDLSSLKITMLPETIGELTHLEHLDLSRNRLQQLPAELAKLTKLRRLDLSYNDEIEVLEPWIGQLSNLEELHLRELSVSELPESMALLHQLHTLDMSYTNLNELPRWLDELPTLQTLNISGLNIGEIPAWFASLQLKQLLYDLKGIPNEHLIGSMSTLQELDLMYDHRNPTTLPEWLRQMHHLRRLCFSGNIVVPLWLMELSQLTYLESYSDFQEIGHVWHNWQSLEHLKCYELATTTLPPNLKTLETTISGSAIPESIRQLHQLEELWLSGEELSELPGWVLELPKLHSLDIANTGIDHILPPAQPNSSLRKLMMDSRDCSGNHSLDGLRSLSRLEELHLTNHSIGKLPAWLHELQHLRQLSIEGCNLTDLDLRLGQLHQLETLRAKGNYIPIARLDQLLSQLSQLKHLSLNLTGTDELPKSICQLDQLCSLSIHMWRNHELPEWINQLEKLEILQISGSELDNPLALESWLALPKLKLLRLNFYPTYPIDPELLQRFIQHGVKVALR